MSNLDRYDDRPIDVYRNAVPTTIIHQPLNQQHSRDQLRQQVELMRELQGMKVNEQFGKLALYGFAGVFSLVGFAFAVSIVKAAFTPSPLSQPIPTPSVSPSPIVVRENPQCIAFCGGSN
ncbi:MAG: hypothetical protein HC769_21670 [Cyanobacteria bacterium CRU_2_1]|nr:hypothetical protein [Cyanobacteria bacterium CRU_2_1]